MRQVTAAIAMGFLVVLVQGCATPATQTGQDRVVLAGEQPGAPSDEEFVKKVERHLDRQDRPGTTLMFR